MTDTEVSLFHLIADIREAAGDPTGKLMQDEFVLHVRKLSEKANMVEELTEEMEEWVAQYGCSCEHPACRHCGRTICARELIAKTKKKIKA